jgi:hypothetical protein
MWGQHEAKEERLDEQVHVFVLKLWCEGCESESASSVWRGSIKNVETHRVVYFSNMAELVDYLRGQMIRPTPDADVQGL